MVFIPALMLVYAPTELRAFNVTMRSDSSNASLSKPSAVDVGKEKITIAKTPSRVDFADLDLSKEFGTGDWGSWGGMGRGPDGRFYFSLGNHLGLGGNAVMLRYDPTDKKATSQWDSRSVIGWNAGSYADGKIHAFPNIGPDGIGYVPTFAGPQSHEASYWGKDKYAGSHLIRFNVLNNSVESLGVPCAEDSWAMSAYDWERGLMFFVGEWGRTYGSGKNRTDWGKVMVYDVKNRETVYCGFAPEEFQWHVRSLILDREGGKVYGTEYVSPYRFMSYDLNTKKFELLAGVRSPTGPVRGCTEEKDKDGAFWCWDSKGMLFRFTPSTLQVDVVGPNWGSGIYGGEALVLSPGKRYLYYLMTEASLPQGFPIVQYDLEARQKKVLAFLNAYSVSKFGFSISKGYGMNLTPDGSTLAFHINGPKSANALFAMHIPAFERVEQAPPATRLAPSAKRATSVTRAGGRLHFPGIWALQPFPSEGEASQLPRFTLQGRAVSQPKSNSTTGGLK